jgi:3-hydroxyisobutyrate dehydrogenase-like beta-hydroxyacid dehydrogenase
MSVTGERSTRVGFLGVGQMGRPMVDRLAAAGWPTSVYVRRPELAAELASAGITVADSPAALAAAVDVLIVCTFSDAQLREVVADSGALAALRSGSVLVSHVTGSPQLARELQVVAPTGVGVLDAPVSGTAESITAGRLTVLAAGDPEHLAVARGPLSSYADPIIDVGRALGDGQRIKLINNLLFTDHLHLALQAAALGESMGFAPADFARVISSCSGDSFAVRLLAGGAPPAVLTASARPFLVKDVGVIRQVASESGIDLGVLGELAGWVDEPA